MSKQDEVAATAIRKSTLISLKEKKRARLNQLKQDYENEIRNINLQYAEDPERLNAKYAAADYAKSEKAKKKAEAKIKSEKLQIELQKNKRTFTLGEEIASSIVQSIGACLFIACTAILETLAIRDATSYINLTTVLYALFGSSMILMFVFSVLRHALPNYQAKEVFNRLSHVFSFLIIGFGYSIYTITKIQGVIGWVLYGIVCAIIIVGAFFYAIAGSKFEKLNIIFYAVSGWAGLVVSKILYTVLSPMSFRMLVLAGIFYLVGLIFYSLRKIKYMHFVGNCIMLVGSIYMFFSLFYINL